MERKSEKLPLSLTKEVKGQLRRIAKHYDRSMNSSIEQLIKEKAKYLDLIESKG